MQQLQIILVVDEDKVGTVLAAIEGKVRAVDFKIVKLLEYSKNKPHTRKTRKDKGGTHKKLTVAQQSKRDYQREYRQRNRPPLTETAQRLLATLSSTPKTKVELRAEANTSGAGINKILNALVIRKLAVKEGNGWRRAAQ